MTEATDIIADQVAEKHWDDLEHDSMIREQIREQRAKKFQGMDEVWALSLTNREVQELPHDLQQLVMDFRSATQTFKRTPTDAIMYLRKLAGTEFDDTFHQIARKLHGKKTT